MKRSRLKRGSSSSKKQRLKSVPKGDTKLRNTVDQFVKSEYEGSMPTKNQDKWLDEFVSQVKTEVGSGKALPDALASAGKQMSDTIDDDEQEPSATVIYGDDETPHIISEYTDTTEGDFDVKWVSTDAWRGYYELTSKNWAKVHTDVALGWSEDEQNLKKFDDELRSVLNKNGIQYARVFSRSSNVFSSGYDFFVKKEDASKVKGVVGLLAVKYRDPEKFRFTALTGTDPSKATPADVKFVKYAGDILSGRKTFEQIKKELKVSE
jgi:hypothetical protein